MSLRNLDTSDTKFFWGCPIYLQSLFIHSTGPYSWIVTKRKTKSSRRWLPQLYPVNHQNHQLLHPWHQWPTMLWPETTIHSSPVSSSNQQWKHQKIPTTLSAKSRATYQRISPPLTIQLSWCPSTITSNLWLPLNP